MELLPLITLLADGEFHSGSKMGEALGVSRTAVWKSLSQLEELGLELESVKGKGYRLTHALDLLDEKTIRKFSKLDDGVLQVQVEPIVSSTNELAFQAVENTSSEFCAVLAERQTQGRGRRGRQWVSPFANNIYLSIGFDFDVGSQGLGGLSLVIGLVVAERLQQIFDAANIDQVAKVKWPNDVLVGGKKIAGILTELQGEATSGWRIVVGLGLNVSSDHGEASLIDQPWVGLADFATMSRNELAGALIGDLVSEIKRFKTEGFSPYIDRWNRYDAFIDQEVILKGREVFGVARGVDHEGSLRIEVNGKTELVNAGEVSLRLVEPRDGNNHS